MPDSILLPDAPSAVSHHAASADGNDPRSLRVLQVSFSCHPDQSMESRIGWFRAVHAARRHEVTVLHGAEANDGLLRDEAQRLGIGDRLHFVSVNNTSLGAAMSRSATTYYAGYRLWHRCAYQTAKALHKQSPFDLVHQTTFCGYREPGDCWRLDAPFVWGPVGGTQAFPMAYLGQLDPRSAWVEVCRNAINAYQLRCCSRVRGASKRAAVVVAATNKAASDLTRLLGKRPPVQLETGLDEPVGPRRAPRAVGEPFNILWSGRLRAWKTLPLLLKALPLLPADVDWRLRVLGVGRCERQWRRLADRLGVSDRIEWKGWPSYRETLPHYRWAHAFAFTSMRDTSGTGLLEALAAGTPIVGVDHQGAADIMSPACAAPIPVGRPRDTIRGFSVALTRLAREPDAWQSLSDGARQRAESFQWERQADLLLDWYTTAVSVGAATAAQPRVAPRPTPLTTPAHAPSST